MNKEKVIGSIFAVVSLCDLFLVFVAAFTGNIAMAVVYLLMSGYFAFRAKQLLSE